MEEIRKLQEDLQTLGNCSKDWQMLINISKCKVIHIGNKQWEVEYTMIGIPLQVNEVERFENYCYTNLKYGHHIAAGVKKTNWVLGMIKGSFKYHSKSIVLKLYKSLVCHTWVIVCRLGDISQKWYKVVGKSTRESHQVGTRFQLTTLPGKTKQVETHDHGIEKTYGWPDRSP